MHWLLFYLFTTATSLQRQRPLQSARSYEVDNGQLFQPLIMTKKSVIVSKFDPYGELMINRGNRISIVFHLFCWSKHKLSTTALANVASLARFFYVSNYWWVSFYFISLYNCITIMGYSKHEFVTIYMFYAPNKNFSYYTATSPQQRPLSCVPIVELEKFDCMCIRSPWSRKSSWYVMSLFGQYDVTIDLR